MYGFVIADITENIILMAGKEMFVLKNIICFLKDTSTSTIFISPSIVYRRHYGRKYHHHHHHHSHSHKYEYYEPSYERVYEKEYDPHHHDDDDFSDIGGTRVAFDTGSRFGGLDLAAALGLSGVGYVANSGGALHVVG